MRIFGKLLGATLAAMAITLAVGGLGWFGLNATRAGLDTVIRVRTPQIHAINQMVETLNTIRIDEFALVNSRLEPERREQILAGLEEATRRLAQGRQAFAALPMTPRQAELWSETEAALDGWAPRHRRMIDLVATRGFVDDHLTDFDVAINDLFGDVASAFDRSVGALKEIATEVSAQAVADSDQATATGTRSQSIALVATIAGILVALAGGILLTRHMTRRLRRTVQMLDELEQGHLDVRLELPGTDEISAMSRAMDAFAEDLEARVRGVNAVAGELVTVAGQIDGACRQVTLAARSQSLGVESTRSAVQEIAGSVRQVSEGVTVLSGASANGTASVLEMAATSEELAGSAASLARIADEVGSSITEVACSIQLVAENSVALKEAADATASSVMQMDATLGEVEAAIRETAQVSAGVRRDVEAGQSAMATAIAGSHEIRQASRVTTTAIGTLSSKVDDIGKILGMIDDVTDQTRLLALNAAIIAAQAGVHGQGFAVVAREIRELSDRASQSTREIAEVIASLQQETGKVVEAVSRSERRVIEGEELALASGAALAKIVAGIQEIDRRMERIGRATIEQTDGSRVIGAAMEKVAEMVDHTALATYQQSVAAKAIAAAVEQLRNYSLQVKTSAREQSNGSKDLAAAIEEIDSMIRRIGLACEEQNRGSLQISRSVEEIYRFAETNRASTSLLEEAVATQQRQVGVLHAQMGSFRLGPRPATVAGEAAEAPDHQDRDQGSESGDTAAAGHDQRSLQRPQRAGDPGKGPAQGPHALERSEDSARRKRPAPPEAPAANA